MPSTEKMLDYDVNIQQSDSIVNSIVLNLLSSGESQWLACLNPHSVVVAQKDTLFNRALHGADFLIPDGIGIVLASRIRLGRIKNRLTGNDVFDAVNRRLQELGGLSVFFLGSTDSNLMQICNNMARDFPAVKVVGSYSPPFKDKFTREENSSMIRAINAVKPDVLWVGLTAPKQEKWIFENKDFLNVRFIGAIGAVFDYYSQRKPRPNAVFRSLGLEWIGRFVAEPGRMWQRVFLSGPKFLIAIICDIFGI